MKIFIKILLVMAISIIPILFIFYRAELPNRTDNGFTRRFVREPPHLLKEFDLGRDVRGIIGTRQGEILLSTDRADQLISISKATGAVRSIPTTASPIMQHALSTIHTFATRLEDDIYTFMISAGPRCMRLIRLTPGLKTRSTWVSFAVSLPPCALTSPL
ncbi:hypothetical protein ACFQRK_09590 [Parapedobacter sp. GCM10030251]|uniref:hypothetical protein n=1 Tax=Parapedobacter sp. GCM10030251 TaxID=3273419 RepID=UPI0036196829